MEREMDGNERDQGMTAPFGGHGFFGAAEEEEGRRQPSGGPTWRALFLAVIAAIVLSVSATLLLGGSFGPAKVAASGGCGPGSVCCPPADSGPGAR